MSVLKLGLPCQLQVVCSESLKYMWSVVVGVETMMVTITSIIGQGSLCTYLLINTN